MTYFFFFVIFIFYTPFCAAEQDLLLLLQHAPTHLIQSIKKEKLEQARKEKLFSGDSSRLAQRLFKKGLKKALLPSLSGFPCFYAGYLDYSAADGTIHFPLRHTSHKLYVVITSSFEIAPLTKNIVHGLRFPENKEASEEDQEEKLLLSQEKETELYLCERKKLNDGTLFWSVTKAPIPENRLISKISLIILTKPKNLVFPTGTFFIDPSQRNHYLLPPMYVVGTINQNKTLLNNAHLLPFFETIDQAVIKTPGIVTQSLITNQ